MESERSILVGGITRRTALKLLASGTTMALLAACGSAATPASSTPPSSGAASSAPTSSVAPTSSAASSAPATSAPASSTATGGAANSGGTLRVAVQDIGTENMDVILSAPNY